MQFLRRQDRIVVYLLIVLILPEALSSLGLRLEAQFLSRVPTNLYINIYS